MTTPVETLLGRLLTTVGNQTLKLDALSEARLAPLADKVIRLDVNVPGGGPARPLALRVDGEPGIRALHIEPGATDTAHVLVEGTLPDLIGHLLDLRSGTDGRPRRAGIRISGDESLLANLAAVVEQFQPDLGEPLAALIGDRAADTLLGAAEAAFAGLKSALQVLGNAAQDGTRAQFVAGPELGTLLDRMAELKLRVDRLAARVDGVQRQRAASRQEERGG